MISVPAPLLFQYIARSTIIFFPADLLVTTMDARPVRCECSCIPKVLRELAWTVSVLTTLPAQVGVR